MEEICFPSAISVFFQMFSIKIFSKFIRVEIRFDYGEHLIRGLIHVRSRPPQILIWKIGNLVLLFGKSWKIMSFETKWIAFFRAKSRCFLPRSRSPAKAMLYADETLLFQGSAIGATQ